jgi:hypothetical protein
LEREHNQAARAAPDASSTSTPDVIARAVSLATAFLHTFAGLRGFCTIGGASIFWVAESLANQSLSML